MHLCINPTWKCQNNCRHCWLNHSIRQRPQLLNATTRPLEDWIKAIKRTKPELVDIAGGEPLLVPWIADLIASCPETRFGLSTNALSIEGVRRLTKKRLTNLVSINASIHPETRKRNYGAFFFLQVRRLVDAGYTVHCNVVDYEDTVKRAEHIVQRLNLLKIPVVVSPYENVKELARLSPIKLRCKAGRNHLVVGPDGLAWPCLTTLRSPYWEEYILGNWLDDDIDLSKVPNPCMLRCTDYFVLIGKHHAGDMWGVKPEQVK
mgnify:CR=1 FL=1